MKTTLLFNPVLSRALLVGFVTLALAPPTMPGLASTPAAPRREIAEEAFSEGLTRMTAARAPERLITSIEFAPAQARIIRLLVRRPHAGQVCLDELEVYGASSTTNLALASGGAVPRASSALAGYAIHAVPHLNDGLYGNDHSWIAATEGEEWAEVELPAPAEVARVVISRDRKGGFFDRQVLEAEVRLSLDGQSWHTAATLKRTSGDFRPPRPILNFPVAELPEANWAGAVTYAFMRERDTWKAMDATDYLSPLVHDRPAVPGGAGYWSRIARMSPTERAVFQFEEMIGRLASQELDVRNERADLASFRERMKNPADRESDALYREVRQAKRRLFFRDPGLAPLERVLFAKRHPYQPSHNYSEHMDSLFASGGAICVLHIPRDLEGRLNPAGGEVETLFDGSRGIVRDPVADFAAQNVYFAFRPDQPEVDGWQPYWHLFSMRTDGTGLRQLTKGPFHDFDPVPLPDGDLGFMTTRCGSRFLCWEPQAYVLYRMATDGSDLRRLSYANISEWNPAVMRDGRILWTRSEYQEKGADFGHTLWAIRPNGEHPELIFGNDTPYGYGHAREVPGSQELICTIISHGDHQGPIALIDPSRGRFNTAAITSITPDTRPQYQMDRSHHETFRDPEPISRDHFLVSHNPGRTSHWSLYVIDRYGNRELLYSDPEISCKRPTLLRARPCPPVLPDSRDQVLAQKGLGQFTIQNVYDGLGPAVAFGRAKYLQVSQELPAYLEKLACGEYRSTHPSFQDFYATPIHLVAGQRQTYVTRTANALQPHAFRTGKAVAANDERAEVTEFNGWPSYVAKAVLGTVPIQEDGSVSFTAPAGKVLYFHLLDGEFNELQRMRSVVQLQPGEQRSCVGCHDDRAATPALHAGLALNRSPQPLDPPPWGARPFDFEQLIQPILDARCVSCHDTKHESQLDLRGIRGPDKVPASYRSLITGGWVHYFDWSYGSRHLKAEPLSFGTLRSRLFEALSGQQHRDLKLTTEEQRALKAWIDLNCPLWPDYQNRHQRPS